MYSISSLHFSSNSNFTFNLFLKEFKIKFLFCFQAILREMDTKGKVDKNLLAQAGIDLQWIKSFKSLDKLFSVCNLTNFVIWNTNFVETCVFELYLSQIRV